MEFSWALSLGRVIPSAFKESSQNFEEKVSYLGSCVEEELEVEKNWGRKRMSLEWLFLSLDCLIKKCRGGCQAYFVLFAIHVSYQDGLLWCYLSQSSLFLINRCNHFHLWKKAGFNFLVECFLATNSLHEILRRLCMWAHVFKRKRLRENGLGKSTI